MPIVEWNSSFFIGVKQFDEHHKHLVGLINRVYDNLTTGASAGSVDAILDELIDYTSYHFAVEENWMREQEYPEVDEHVIEHESFVRRVTQMLHDIRANKDLIMLELITFLNKWLVEHILKVDAEYGRYIATKGLPMNLA
jgi:hemerythrin